MSSVMAQGKRIGHVIPCHLSYFCVAALMSNGGEACGYLNPTFPPPLLLSPIFLFHRHLTMSSLGLKGIWLPLLLVFLVMCSNFHDCEGRRGKHRRAKQPPSSSLARKKAKGSNGGDRRHGSGGGSGGQSRPTPETIAAMFDVLDFGAKGDGVTDDTKAFEAAWAAACKVEASTVIVPAEFEFLVRPISFSGPYCEPNIVFQLDGTIVAPTSAGAWGAGSLQWLEFTKLQEITIRGSGVIDGRGSVWWTNSDSDIDPINGELGSKMPQIKPTALRFYGSYNVTVTGIRIQNSPRCHLKFDNCEAVEVFNITVSSPGDSPNTDGIHLQNSRNVLIHRVDMGCGDDCVSIQTGCSNIYIHDVDCGPGHGISIGGLGRDNTKACVSNITVRDINLRNTMTGVRIKTWQGGSGSVQAIQFSNIKVWEVQIPMVIDQFYCDRSSCENQSSAVALSSIAYESIRGTFTVKPVHLACSDSSPCSGISLSEVELEPLQERYHMTDPFCWQAFGELYAPTIPPITCLQIGKPASSRISTDHDLC